MDIEVTEEVDVTERHQEVVFPFSWESWDGDVDYQIFYKVIFREDFGEIKKDIEYTSVQISDGNIEVFFTKEDDEPNITQKYKATPCT